MGPPPGFLLVQPRVLGLSSVNEKRGTILRPSDLVGCRYRGVQRLRFGDLPEPESSIARKRRLAAAQEAVRELLPTRASIGDKGRFLRVDIPREPEPTERFLATLEAIAAGASLIVGPVLEYDFDEPWQVFLDALYRRPDGTYVPVMVSNHRVARPDPNRRVNVVATARLGLGKEVPGGFKLKSHALDSYALAMADRILDECGVACHRGGLIGQDRSRVFILDTDLLQQGLERALEVPPPPAARRIAECAGCRFWPVCEKELTSRDDLSLFLPGQRGNKFREQGIETVQALIDAQLGAPSSLAAAWRAGIDVLKKVERPDAPRFDVEIDIDVEAYLDQGAYLWGAFDGERYHPFATFEGVGGEAEAQNFARFVQWIRGRAAQTKAAGQSFGVFCYSQQGENHWLRFSARRFAGTPGVPSIEEVEEFIASEHWVDVFALVKSQLAGPHGLGLKVVAPAAGFTWDAEDVDGEESINLYRDARGFSDEAERARETLLSYNGDDCRATRAVREWLRAGVPGAPSL